VIYALYLGFIVAPYIMSEMLGKPATEFGIYVLFLSVGYFLGNFVVSRIRGHAQLERVARFGTILQASACTAAAFVLAGHTDPIDRFGPMMPLAFAQGLALPHVTASAVRLVPNYAGVASSMIGLAQQAAAAIAVQGGTLPTDSPVPVLSVCAAMSLISLCAHDGRRSRFATGRDTGNMKLGLALGYWGSKPLDRFIELAQHAERLGFQIGCTSEAYGSDAFTPLAAIAAERRKLDSAPQSCRSRRVRLQQRR
jgi:hypothetical protein